MRKSIVNKGLFIAAMAIIVFPLFIAAIKVVSDPEVSFLLPVRGAEWIQLKRPFNLGTWEGDEGTIYRKHIFVDKAFSDTVLTVKALRSAQVFLDGKLVMPFNYIEDWKRPRSVDLKDLRVPGLHELRIVVLNENGPVVLLAYNKSLTISTGEDWEAGIDGTQWRPVMSVNEKGPAELSQRFPTSFSALWTLFPFHLFIFIVSFILMLFFSSPLKKSQVLEKVTFRPSVVRWFLLAAWVLLAANNMSKIPLKIGFDVTDHYAYISYIAEKGAIPLATDGWQMFQSPLYYLVSAVPQLLLLRLFPADTVAIILRAIPLICGVLQVELAFRAVRYVFPARGDLQVLGTMIGGFLPMNLYLSQAVGNEPLAGALSATAIVMTLGIMTFETDQLPLRKSVLLGTVLGLALLTKVTALLLVPAIILVLTYVMVRRETPLKRILGGIFTILVVIAAVSGWYYLRNWIELGKPFVGGWDPSRKIVWWQDPGYRTISDFMSYGSSLIHPIYSATHGFWDSIYSTFWLDGFLCSIISYKIRPPWNYNFMLSGALLSLLPAAAILLGFIRAIIRPKTAHPAQVFSAYCVAVYFTALLYLYVTVPIYSTAKATYTIGLVPCYAILCMTGLDFLLRHKYLGAAVKALLICWAFNAYFSYFVL